MLSSALSVSSVQLLKCIKVPKCLQMPWESQVPQVQSSALRVSSTTSALTAQEFQNCKRNVDVMSHKQTSIAGAATLPNALR